jgi:hypothetical protein
MALYRRSKTNTMYFSDIPPLKNKKGRNKNPFIKEDEEEENEKG